MSFDPFKDNKIFIAVIMTVVICVVDILAPLWYDVWVLYLLPLFFMFQSAKRPYVFSTIVTLLIVAGLVVSHSDGTELRHAAANRMTGILGGWGVSFLLMQLKRLQMEALRKSGERLHDMTSHLAEGIYTLDQQGHLTFMNPEAERLLGWTETELLGRKLDEIIHCKQNDDSPVPPDDCIVMKPIQTGTVCRDDENYFIRKDASSFPVSIVASPLMENGRSIGCVAAFQDITERKDANAELKRLNELLEHQATTDSLTGISNRLKFNERLNMELRRSKRFGTSLSLIMFDADHFKAINDTYGHDTGDRVLRELADLVSRNMRMHDLLARWGGEEFMIIVTNTGKEGAAQLAEKLRGQIEKSIFAGAASVRCSFGVTDYIKDETFEKLVQKADLALYHAKSRGRNRVEVT